MKIFSSVKDHKIGSTNVFAEMTFQEYLELAPMIISNNQFQRRRVKTSKSVYSLLKKDLQMGCIIPPIVLAITDQDIDVNVDFSPEVFLDYMKRHTNEILILDGLQRTYTLIDAENELKQISMKEMNPTGSVYNDFCNYKLRVEIYYDINKYGVLYRMLTLNTGQTPMSARHQIEILYSDMLETDIEGIRLISDMDGTARASENEFLFKNTVEGFHSYMSRNELPIDRQELLDNIKMLEKMSEENIDKDLFKEYLECYVRVFNALRRITKDEIVTQEDVESYDIKGAPFSTSVSKAFSTSQALTGFGAAAGRMKDKNVISSFSDITDHLNLLEKENAGTDWFLEMLKKLDLIRDNSKKIGNAQRLFLHYFFRELFNAESDSFLDLESAVENGYQKYLSQVLL